MKWLPEQIGIVDFAMKMDVKSELIRGALLLLLLLSANVLSQQRIEVIAVEYPPISSLSIENGGMAFVLLRQNTLYPDITWIPTFMPPGRASAVLESDEWCASFYPTFTRENIHKMRLAESPVLFGLVRKTEDGAFRWSSLDELAGKSMAVLRSKERFPLYDELERSEISLIFVETLRVGAQMVLLDRVDMALIDELTFNNIEHNNRKKLQFSKTPVVEMHIDLYLNPRCANEILPNLGGRIISLH